MGQCHHSAARDVDAGTGLLKPTGGNQALASMKEKRAMQPRHQPIASDAMAYVLAGGRGSRLAELTDRRATPAVHFGGKARINDFALSNALNSGIMRIGDATHYK